MDKKSETPPTEEMNKQALRVFALLAMLIYIMSMYYCIITYRYFEAGLLLFVILFSVGTVTWAFKSPN